MNSSLSAARIPDATPTEVARLFDAVILHCEIPDRIHTALVDMVLAQLVQRQRRVSSPITDDLRNRITLLYKHLDESHPCRWRLLQWLATAAETEDLRAFVKQIVADPPRDFKHAALAITPLFQHHEYDPAVLFPDLLEALQHVSVAAPILDLSNYLFRSSAVTQHPASSRTAELASLLGSLVQQLALVEEAPGPDETPEDLSRKVDEGVALIISLCDALALIGDKNCVGKLCQALELSHRRIRTEAAAALARLGESRGVDELVRLAAEPAARLRVLASAEGLGISDRIDPQYKTEVARAEALVAVELAQPSLFGLPPTELALVDTRTLYWPGYEKPVECFLFRYAYRFEAAEYSNIAIAGPLVHAFAADLHDLSPDDIYAAYAGWDLEDENVYEIPLDGPEVGHEAEIDRFERRLREDGYESIEGAKMGFFFGDRVFVARAARGGVAGTAVADQQMVEWYPVRTRRHPIGPNEAYCIYKGRRLLRAFNE